MRGAMMACGSYAYVESMRPGGQRGACMAVTILMDSTVTRMQVWRACQRDETIGTRIRKARERLGISRTELAKLCAVHVTHIGLLERTRDVPQVSLSFIVSLSLHLQISIDYLLFGKHEKRFPALTSGRPCDARS